VVYGGRESRGGAQAYTVAGTDLAEDEGGYFATL